MKSALKIMKFNNIGLYNLLIFCFLKEKAL